MHKHMLILFLAVLLWFSSIANAAVSSFPSELSEVRAPSGHYSIICTEGDYTGEIPHRLYLKNLYNGRITKLLEFYRQVDILWSPDSRFVAVTDWTASNISQILLFEPGKKKHINIEDALYKSLGTLPEIENSDHVYFEALSWNEPKKLLFTVFGHGAPGMKMFQRYFQFTIPDKVRELKLRELKP